MERGLAGESIDVQFFVDRHSREAEWPDVWSWHVWHVIRESEMVVKFQLQVAGMHSKGPMIRHTISIFWRRLGCNREKIDVVEITLHETEVN